jgi:hypothetical protein
MRDGSLGWISLSRLTRAASLVDKVAGSKMMLSKSLRGGIAWEDLPISIVERRVGAPA